MDAKQEVKNIYKEIFELELSDEEINLPIEETDIDMLDFVELIIGIEKHFNISIPNNTCDSFESINDIIEYLKKELVAS